MDILTVINTVLIIILFIILFSKKLGSIIPSGGETDKGFYKFPKTFTESEKQLLIKIHEKFYQQVLNNEVPLDIIYSVLWQESGYQILKDLPNDKIIGDNGNSIGYFQIYKFGALLEVNQRENKNYTFDDLKDEDTNIYFGLKYLSYCLQSAYNQVKNKPLQWLVFKKYNGGISQTENSISQANNYADNCYQKFQKVQKFINMNLS